jgi:hypothetical protein
MKGCILHGKVEFPGGEAPLPRWPGRETSARKDGLNAPCDDGG